MSSLGTRIKQLRERYNISQKDFAQKINVSNVVLSRYESDERKPDYDTLEKIADYFEVSVDYLLGRSSTQNKSTNENEEFQVFANDPSLQKWYKELPKSKEEDLRKLRKMWEILKDNGEL
ncbi:helix-turn-helix domain-containing protein [Rummeliibacillus sp. POC4]|uniref:helix-turn-helix domain-containing protein n=1 Tax=Rummeliibacillus sp. POC4 TaxID=2305899 RepID=UPI000E66127B|nr:helix-turn-helix transcriptional regulator [Rummeliibacillus sp. POC4]RIJ65500.1 XRE family transcriptional regulator [Rummeliibacillus sp. POC4]